MEVLEIFCRVAVNSVKFWAYWIDSLKTKNPLKLISKGFFNSLLHYQIMQLPFGLSDTVKHLKGIYLSV